MINVNRLVKTFGATRAVDDVTFDVKPGEVLGFLGPNGAGKSTTIRMITCFLTPDSGTVNVDGHDTQLDSIEVRKLIGYLPENNPLYMDMDVTDYLNYIAEVRRIPGGRRKARVDEVIDICSLGAVRFKAIGELSKGFRQRVGLSQTLLHDPGFLILDEPTSGLDPTQIIEIRNLIREIGKEKAVMLSTHILPEVEATCDRVIIINKGKIAIEGGTNDLSRKAEGEAILHAAIKGPAPEIETKLSALEGADSAAVEKEIAPGHCRYIVRSAHGVDLSEQVFNAVVSNKWILTELSLEAVTLEDVFLQLTRSEESGA
ncbi:MAG TPA: ATP-binding cassette domain-containing protein [bacterium]|nr:ATP-binding cassette domain-containing protein [bacterium]